jgi:hypothetical protein
MSQLKLVFAAKYLFLLMLCIAGIGLYNDVYKPAPFFEVTYNITK